MNVNCQRRVWITNPRVVRTEHGDWSDEGAPAQTSGPERKGAVNHLTAGKHHQHFASTLVYQGASVTCAAPTIRGIAPTREMFERKVKRTLRFQLVKWTNANPVTSCEPAGVSPTLYVRRVSVLRLQRATLQPMLWHTPGTPRGPLVCRGLSSSSAQACLSDTAPPYSAPEADRFSAVFIDAWRCETTALA